VPSPNKFAKALEADALMFAKAEPRVENFNWRRRKESKKGYGKKKLF
jgi:hypothetical protein